MIMLWLPGARIVDFGTDGGSWTDTTDPKGCLHTTEGGSWPTYDSGAKAPHLTVLPLPRVGVEVHQHVSFAHAARALRNPAGGVQTNRDYVFQVELIGTSAKGGPGYYWPDADDAVLADLYRKVVGPIAQAFGIPLVAPPWQAYPASYGARGSTNTVRMSGATFDHYTGWLGHEHAPENDHGDPGLFPWARMLAAAGATITTQEDDMPTAQEVAAALLDHPLGSNPATGKPTTVGDALDIAKNYSYKGWQELIARRGDYARVAQAVLAELPQDTPVTDAQLEAALRKVLGSVDDVSTGG